jgi:[protein-PII] uridylyltransferase
MFDNLLQQLDQGTQSIADYKQTHKAGRELLAEKFHAGEAIEILVRGRAELVDQLLHRVWQKHIGDNSAASLIAVGGYGRGELHPASDVDLLILTQDEPETLAFSIRTPHHVPLGHRTGSGS